MTAAINRVPILADGTRSPLQLTAGESTLVTMAMIDPSSPALAPLSFDLTGCTVKVTFRAAAPNGTVQGEAIFAPTVLIADPPTLGIASFMLIPANTSSWSGIYTWDAWVTDAAGNRCVRVRASLVQVSESDTAPVTGGD